MIKFCFSCGNKLNYNYSPPKFCSNCGERISGSIEKPQKEESDVSLGEDETTESEIPQIEKLEYELDFGSDGIKKLGQIMGQRSSSVAKVARRRNLEDLKDDSF